MHRKIRPENKINKCVLCLLQELAKLENLNFNKSIFLESIFSTRERLSEQGYFALLDWLASYNLDINVLILSKNLVKMLKKFASSTVL